MIGKKHLIFTSGHLIFHLATYVASIFWVNFHHEAVILTPKHALGFQYAWKNEFIFWNCFHLAMKTLFSALCNWFSHFNLHSHWVIIFPSAALWQSGFSLSVSVKAQTAKMAHWQSQQSSAFLADSLVFLVHEKYCSPFGILGWKNFIHFPLYCFLYKVSKKVQILYLASVQETILCRVLKILSPEKINYVNQHFPNQWTMNQLFRKSDRMD